MTIHKISQPMSFQTEEQDLVPVTVRDWSRLYDMVSDITFPDRALCAQAYFCLGLAGTALFCIVSFASSGNIHPAWWVLACTILFSATGLGFVLRYLDDKMQRNAVSDAQKVIKEMDRHTPAPGRPGPEPEESRGPQLPDWLFDGPTLEARAAAAAAAAVARPR